MIYKWLKLGKCWDLKVVLWFLKQNINNISNHDHVIDKLYDFRKIVWLTWSQISSLVVQTIEVNYIMYIKVLYKPAYKFQLLMTNLAYSEFEKLSAGFSKLLIFLYSHCLWKKQSSVLLNMKISIFSFRINAEIYLTTY